MPFLGNGRHGVDQHAVNAVLHHHFDVAGLDVDVTGAPLERGEDHRIHQPHDGADGGIAREAVGEKRIFAFLFVLHHLQSEGFGGLFENALGLLGALQQVADLRGRGDLQDQFLAQQQGQFVAQQDLAGIGHCDDQAGCLAPPWARS